MNTDVRVVFPGSCIHVGLKGKVPVDDPSGLGGQEFEITAKDETADANHRWWALFKDGKRELLCFPMVMSVKWFKSVFNESR